MTTHFIYEEFPPNHKHDIERIATQFFDGWFKRRFDEYNWSVGDVVLPEGKVLPRKEALKKMQDYFDRYTAFENTKYEMFDISFELYAATSTGMGHAEGAVIYRATTEGGQQQLIKGMFKLYMALDDGN